MAVFPYRTSDSGPGPVGDPAVRASGDHPQRASGVTRREMVATSSAAGIAFACAWLPVMDASAGQDGREMVEALVGRPIVPSPRVRLIMPSAFPSGYTVPMELAVDSAMDAADHVRSVRVFAPKNPIVEIVRFDFRPGRGVPHVATRIRLAGPQHVFAVAEMGDDAMLAGSAWVDVATNGCT